MSEPRSQRRPPRVRERRPAHAHGAARTQPPRRRGRPIPAARAAWAVLTTELRGLLRDRRALFFSLLLPIALYPLLFVIGDRLERMSRESMAAREVGVALALDELPAPFAERVRALLAAKEPIALHEAEPERTLALEAAEERGTSDARELSREELEQLSNAGVQLVLRGRPDPEVLGRALFSAWYDGANDLSNEARDRVGAALDELEEEERRARLDELLGGDPAAALTLESIDVASEADKGGAALGRMLPLIAVLILLSGGSFAALAAFAGEREARTLETLLVQPVSAGAIVWGKFGAVLAVGCVTLVLNAASVLASLAMGLGNLPGADPEAGPLAFGLPRLLLSSLVFLPACVLLCALLCLVCGRARTYREGQHYVMPLVFAAIVPTLLATRPEVELDLVFACIPLAGPALAFRDALTGDLRFLPGALAMLSSALWSVIALARLAPLVDAEKLLQDRDSESEGGGRRLVSRRALRYGWAGVIATYLVGGLMQSAHALWGLVATLWILLPALALACARGTARRTGSSLRDALMLRAPSPRHALGALCLAPALAKLARAGIEWQQHLLPMPSSFLREELVPPALAELSTLGLLAVFALSPAVCEELFFRGAVLAGLRRDLAGWKVVLVQALLFGAVHASIYRFAPTALLGALLAALTLQSKSLVPAMLLHAAYNALHVLDARVEAMPLLLQSPLAAAAAAAVGLALFFVPSARPTAP